MRTREVEPPQLHQMFPLGWLIECSGAPCTTSAAYLYFLFVVSQIKLNCEKKSDAIILSYAGAGSRTPTPPSILVLLYSQ
jgi:hypothetical protein